MISYREAISSDWENIALLHARSWQLHYRGSMTDDYLDNQVVDERKSVWKKRFEEPNDKQLVTVVESDNLLIGLLCVFLDANVTYGALLDNLHVHPNYMRQGIGKVLMKKSADLALQHNQISMYLWVLTGNENAIQFYESVGGIRHDTVTWKTPDNTSGDTYRYVWNDLKKLSNLI